MAESADKAIENKVKDEFRIWVFGFNKKQLTLNDIQTLRVRIREEKFDLYSPGSGVANQAWFSIYLRLTDLLEKILGTHIWDRVMAVEQENHQLMYLNHVITSAGEAEKSMITMLLDKLAAVFKQDG